MDNNARKDESNSPDYEKVLEKVNNVLQENFVTTPPVRVDELAKNYGLVVKEADFRGDAGAVAGYINLQNKEIVVNKDDSETRKAFTMAHELGHWLLHKKELKKNPDIGILYRIPLGRMNNDPLEKEANAFAANLLIPKNLLKEYKGLYNDENTLAKIFGVSTEALGYRLKHFKNE